MEKLFAPPQKYRRLLLTGLLINVFFVMACELFEAPPPGVGGDTQAKTATFATVSDIRPGISSKIGADAISLGPDGTTLLGTNFGLVSIHSDGSADVKTWRHTGNVVEQIGRDDSRSQLWIYHRELGILKDLGSAWRVYLTVDSLVKTRGDQFRIPNFVFMDDGVYLNTPQNVLRFDKASESFSPIRLPDIQCENTFPLGAPKVVYESRCLVSIGSFSGKLALIQRTFDPIPNSQPPREDDVMFDRIFVLEGDSWRSVFDGSNGKHFFDKIITSDKGAVALTNVGEVGTLSGDNRFVIKPELGKVAMIGNTSQFGPIAVKSDGSVVSIDNPSQILFSTGREFANRYEAPVFDSLGNVIALAWDADNCISILNWDGSVKTQTICN